MEDNFVCFNQNKTKQKTTFYGDKYISIVITSQVPCWSRERQFGSMGRTDQMNYSMVPCHRTLMIQGAFSHLLLEIFYQSGCFITDFFPKAPSLRALLRTNVTLSPQVLLNVWHRIFCSVRKKNCLSNNLRQVSPDWFSSPQTSTADAQCPLKWVRTMSPESRMLGHWTLCFISA